jgi:two-component system, NtrC family, response regulator AtoC
VLLAERFIAEHTAGRAPLTLGNGVVEALERYAWPGNLRELRNTIARAVALCDGDEITPQHLPEQLAHDTDQGGAIAAGDWIGAPSARDKTGQIVIDPPHEPHNVTMKQLERDRIIAALDACQGNQTRAAQLLQMPRRTLVYKLTALGIDGRRGRRSER